MAKRRILDQPAFDALRPYALLAGATQAMPMEFPTGFDAAGVRPRDPLRNEFMGLTVTQPEDDVIAFGLAYHDRKDGATDEDTYTLDLRTRELTYFGRGRWEKRDPRYRGTHRGSKDYFS